MKEVGYGEYDSGGEALNEVAKAALKPSPGPWQSHRDGTYHGEDYYVVTDKTGMPIAWTRGGVHPTPNGAANAPILAAGPEMLAALRGVILWLAPYDGNSWDIPAPDEELVGKIMDAIKHAQDVTVWG